METWKPPSSRHLGGPFQWLDGARASPAPRHCLGTAVEGDVRPPGHRPAPPSSPHPPGPAEVLASGRPPSPLAALRKQPSPPAGRGGGGTQACPRISPWVTAVCRAPKTPRSSPLPSGFPLLCLTDGGCFPGFPQVLVISLIITRCYYQCVTSFSKA